jgi:hypothetical protein
MGELEATKRAFSQPGNVKWSTKSEQMQNVRPPNRVRGKFSSSAAVAELASAQDLGSCGETLGGSSPLCRTIR